MTKDQAGLVPIGRFSAMSRLSVKALRLYDELGLLPPAAVDPLSGYRYYHAAQANRAEAIRVLRALEVPLDEIAELLACDDVDLVSKHLERHRERLQQRLADQERMLRFLARLIDRKEGVMPYEITVQEVPGQPVAALRCRTDLAGIGAALGEAFRVVAGAVASSGAQPAGAPFVVYHDVIDETSAGDIEVCVPVPPATAPPAPADEGAVRWRTTAGGPVARTLHRGPYAEIAPAYHSLEGWMRENGHRPAGPPREVYLNDPATTLPEDLLTEVQWPVSHAR
ncbi:MerR family transcriptional regulator [Aquipuribacter nitratireducens]|uniref:MerR family transcriptional regulator n=1 Tax=Aquipuribacter nitratireducens TaxID=650104 RepID=A0ABW0GJB8_9MICO